MVVYPSTNVTRTRTGNPSTPGSYEDTTYVWKTDPSRTLGPHYGTRSRGFGRKVPVARISSYGVWTVTPGHTPLTHQSTSSIKKSVTLA